MSLHLRRCACTGRPSVDDAQGSLSEIRRVVPSDGVPYARVHVVMALTDGGMSRKVDVTLVGTDIGNFG